MEKKITIGRSGKIGRSLSKSLDTIADLTVLHNKSNFFNRKSISLDLLNLKNIEVFVKNNKKYDTCIFLVGLAIEKEKRVTMRSLIA